MTEIALVTGGPGSLRQRLHWQEVTMVDTAQVGAGRQVRATFDTVSAPALSRFRRA